MAAQRRERPALRADEALQLAVRQRQLFVDAADQRVDRGDVVGDVLGAAGDQRERTGARIAGRQRHIGEQPLRLGHDANGERGPVAQRIGELVERRGDRAQAAAEPIEHATRDRIAAEQIEVEAAGEQDVAQVDRMQQDRRVTARPGRIGRGEQQVARRLQALGEPRLVGEPAAERGLIAPGRNRRLQQAGARAQQVRRGAQHGDEREAPIVALQQRRGRDRPAEVSECAGHVPADEGERTACRAAPPSNTSARIGANDTGPARGPQAIVIIATKAIAITPIPRAAGCAASSATSSAADDASTAAASTRCQVRPTVSGRSARLAQTAALPAICATAAPPRPPNSRWMTPIPVATAMPLTA